MNVDHPDPCATFIAGHNREKQALSDLRDVGLGDAHRAKEALGQLGIRRPLQQAPDSNSEFTYAVETALEAGASKVIEFVHADVNFEVVLSGVDFRHLVDDHRLEVRALKHLRQPEDVEVVRPTISLNTQALSAAFDGSGSSASASKASAVFALAACRDGVRWMCEGGTLRDFRGSTGGGDAYGVTSAAVAGETARRGGGGGAGSRGSDGRRRGYRRRGLRGAPVHCIA